MSQEPTRRVVNPGLTARRTAPPAMPAPDVKPRVRNLEPDIEPDTDQDIDHDDGFDETALDRPPDDEVVRVSAPTAKPKVAAILDPAVAKFSRSYTAHGEPVTEVRFRKPVAKDLRVGGRPFRPVTDSAGKQVDLEYDEERIARYIPLLSSPPLPPSTVDQLEMDDFYECAAAIAYFFLKAG